jgi:hypothetical protein
MTRALYDSRQSEACDEAPKAMCGDHRNQGQGARGQSQGPQWRRTSDSEPPTSALKLPHAGLYSLLGRGP